MDTNISENDYTSVLQSLIDASRDIEDLCDFGLEGPDNNGYYYLVGGEPYNDSCTEDDIENYMESLYSAGVDRCLPLSGIL